MWKVLGGLLGAAAIVAGLFGLLFLVGSAGHGYRLAVGGVGLVMGAVLLVTGVLCFRHGQFVSPERIRAEILELARRRCGLVAEGEVAAALGTRASRGAMMIDQMAAGGVCRRELRNGSMMIVFPELLSALVVRQCRFCSAELPLSSEVANCPRCGGLVATTHSAKDAGEDYRMDE